MTVRVSVSVPIPMSVRVLVLYISAAVCWQVSVIKFVMSCRHEKGFLSAIYFISALLFLFPLSLRLLLAYFYGTYTGTDKNKKYNYKDLQCPAIRNFMLSGYDMFISVCVSFLMIFNYAGASYFTRAIKRSILYSARRCRV